MKAIPVHPPASAPGKGKSAPPASGKDQNGPQPFSLQKQNSEKKERTGNGQ